MKVKNDNRPAIIIAIGIIIVIVLVFIGNRKHKSTDYSNLTDEEIAVVVEKEINEMEVSELSSMGERDRIEYYVSSFVEAIEDKEYEKAYNMLYDTFKKNYFPTLSSFEEYAENKFPKMLSLDHTNFERNGDYYILWITMSDPLGGKNSGIEMNFVVQENDLNDFVMSFSVI